MFSNLLQDTLMRSQLKDMPDQDFLIELKPNARHPGGPKGWQVAALQQLQTEKA